MKHSPGSETQKQSEQNTLNKIKTAYIFNNQSTDDPLPTCVKPAFIVNDDEPIEISDEAIDTNQTLEYSEPVTIKKTRKKWPLFLFVAMLLASSAELAFFMTTMVTQIDWLAGVWLVIFSILGFLVLRQALVEYRGLKQLERQAVNRSQSEQISNTSVIGLAEQHCIKIAKSLPHDYQYLVTNWRDSFDPHHCDSEVLSLFEYQVLGPIDELAIKHVSKNVSAASVMIAVSPFVLLDMLIVLWRNIRMMNQVSQIYGLHLGYWARVKLIRKIFHTMLYAGATEILSDAGNYALSAGITGKLSIRVAQGMGAGVLTARIGLKVINESRPLPWLSQIKPSLSGITKRLLADLHQQFS